MSRRFFSPPRFGGRRRGDAIVPIAVAALAAGCLFTLAIYVVPRASFSAAGPSPQVPALAKDSRAL